MDSPEGKYKSRFETLDSPYNLEWDLHYFVDSKSSQADTDYHRHNLLGIIPMDNDRSDRHQRIEFEGVVDGLSASRLDVVVASHHASFYQAWLPLWVY